jgi:hypothetical protein
MSLKLVTVLALAALAHADPSATDLLQDIYHSCLSGLSVSCVKPKALAWMSYVSDKPEIRLTEDLVILKKRDVEEQRGPGADVFDKFEDFLPVARVGGQSAAISPTRRDTRRVGAEEFATGRCQSAASCDR